MKKQEVEIFKIQRPIMGNEGDIVLCYNEDRSICGLFPMTKELSKLFNKDEYKIYVVGYYKGAKIHIVKKIKKDFVGF